MRVRGITNGTFDDAQDALLPDARAFVEGCHAATLSERIGLNVTAMWRASGAGILAIIALANLRFGDFE